MWAPRCVGAWTDLREIVKWRVESNEQHLVRFHSILVMPELFIFIFCMCVCERENLRVKFKRKLDEVSPKKYKAEIAIISVCFSLCLFPLSVSQAFVISCMMCIWCDCIVFKTCPQEAHCPSIPRTHWCHLLLLHLLAQHLWYYIACLLPIKHVGLDHTLTQHIWTTQQSPITRYRVYQGYSKKICEVLGPACIAGAASRLCTADWLHCTSPFWKADQIDLNVDLYRCFLNNMYIFSGIIKYIANQGRTTTIFELLSQKEAKHDREKPVETIQRCLYITCLTLVHYCRQLSSVKSLKKAWVSVPHYTTSQFGHTWSNKGCFFIFFKNYFLLF